MSSFLTGPPVFPVSPIIISSSGIFWPLEEVGVSTSRYDKVDGGILPFSLENRLDPPKLRPVLNGSSWLVTNGFTSFVSCEARVVRLASMSGVTLKMF